MWSKKISIPKTINMLFLGLALFVCAAMIMPSLAAEKNGAGMLQIAPPVEFEEGTFLPSPNSSFLLGDKVLLYCGNSGNCSEGLTALTDFYNSMGIAVDQLTSFPADLSVYRLIFIIMPNDSFSSSQVSALDTFILAGGRLVLLSDYPSFYTGQPVLNELLNNLGVPMQLDANGVDVGCEQFTSNITPNQQITMGVTSFEYAYTDTITSSSPAKVLIRTNTTNEPMVVMAQPPGALPLPAADVVVAGDSNSFTDLCAPLDNETFWANLYNFSLWSIVYTETYDLTNPSDAVLTLRAYRDRVISANPEGDELVDTLYEKHSDSLAQILLSQPELMEKAESITAKHISGIKKAVKGGEMEMTPLELLEIKAFLRDVAESGDAELKEYINSAQNILNKRGLAPYGVKIVNRRAAPPNPSKDNLTTTWSAIKRNHQNQ
jgi:hypothetical protein